MLSTVIEHDRVASDTKKTFRARDAVECSNVYLSVGNKRGVLRMLNHCLSPLDNSHITVTCYRAQYRFRERVKINQIYFFPGMRIFLATITDDET